MRHSLHYKDKIPSDIIARDQMAGILWEMIQADQYSNQFLDKDSIKAHVRSATATLYDDVLQMHHVTRDDFHKSLDFYMSHPDISQPMFDSLYVQANRQRSKIYERHPIPSNIKALPKSGNKADPLKQLFKCIFMGQK